MPCELITPDLAELTQTVARMRARYAQHPHAQMQLLFAQYLRVEARFAEDLADTRDRALACASALMVLQEAARDLPSGAA
jgi:hypothetical protein